MVRVNADGSITVGILKDAKDKAGEKPAESEKKPTKKKKKKD